MRRSLRFIGLTVVALLLTAAPALAQSPSPATSPSLLPTPKASHSWTFYMAIATIAIAGLTLIMVVLGYLVQAPGFRRVERPARPS